MFYNVLIIGVGLIGGSLGLALKESPLVKSVAGYDIDRATLKKAINIGAIDYGAEIPEAAAQADIIFLCTSPALYPEILNQMRGFLKSGTIITDVGSTKQKTMCLFASLPRGVWTIGGHPMAGAETAGIDGADRYIFENAVYILSPAAGTPDQVLQLLTELLKVTGARIKIMDAEKHDKLVASISHVPHLAAAALVQLANDNHESLILAAGGFRDTTRIASSSPELWLDILFSNSSYVLDTLDEFIRNLNNMKAALKTGDRKSMKENLENARNIRDSIPRIHRGLIPEFSDVVCIVPDRPGIIGEIGAILGKRDVNIVDIEILRVREGDGGTIRIGVPSSADAAIAVTALQAHDMKAWVR